MSTLRQAAPWMNFFLGRINMLKAFLTDESGATMIEYGLIAALVSVAAIVALRLLGTALVTIFTNVKDELVGAV
jgi:pilus assembly protein Flp/PilA